MRIHILGICGTFMGSLALLARDIGIRVSGSDEHVYPPMSTQLEAEGIQLMQGYHIEHLDDEPDLVVIGNAMSRGNPIVEHVLNKGLAYTSGPQFFAEHILKDKWVMAAAGTHGKTTTGSMLAWILEYAGMSPGFLIGGIPANFGISARMGKTPFFVVEADEYDTAFFDKRSKFVHYHPRTAILNNLEFDHADIFENLAAIQKQFHHLVRTIPGDGRIISPANCEALNRVLEMGCWSQQEQLGVEWTTHLIEADGSVFDVIYQGKVVGQVNWSQTGDHNVANGLAAIAAARHVGVLPALACEALSLFKGVKRRMELLADIEGIKVYDDFAHHPTAIETTLNGLRARHQNDRIRAIIEPRSNTMKMGIHGGALSDCVKNASEVIWFQPTNIEWLQDGFIDKSPVSTRVMSSTEEIIDYLIETSEEGDHLVIMSNGGFEGIHQRLLVKLNNAAASKKG
ncbi:UDP-N-acetylmuramate:L-alanyl-gamma-D-glutamyl-meso-diaminopimelate ligase [Endozoicomonas sp. 8E]|uniref:UDP-N-acetylmuramate:L-alanyl-gamma-D-glutamyl- meso-diaminopimelate ligase n=1 Tax=Endozoicomonas sp. 8E TaxID=3035692 RepID=UPI0029391A05|nr:UDP-N-acetylmuramate:L-alanyl-gamma-D-glutamyl-meso-diaminopimelate ligase [Endozoicomonas sp. 8E]WOG26905.1 UDP-N-acetylmuramate:L-alanyl-gamma-D-glutamyl-meso-diaminopimelate ligase [Endozoicomonas sp. 8E]